MGLAFLNATDENKIPFDEGLRAEAEAAARERRDARKWRRIFAGMPVPAVVFDARGRLTDVARAVEVLVPGALSSWPGDGWLESIAPDRKEDISKAWRGFVARPRGCFRRMLPLRIGGRVRMRCEPVAAGGALLAFVATLERLDE